MLRNLFSRVWILLVVCFILLDLLIVAGLVFLFTINETERVVAAELAQKLATPTPTVPATATATPWPGPPPSPTPTATLPPSPTPTEVLAPSGFPVGFTPTPRPTREPVFITLPIVAPVYASSVDVPVINQIHYPEPFFPPGSNNACGPVALFAALHALGANVDYIRLRDIAVTNGFTSYGISKAGMIRTISTINQELGQPFTVEYGNHYATKDLMQHIRKGGVAVVLIRVRKEGGRYRVTADTHNSVGHFLIVESINMRTKTVQFAGSTLGMDKVSLQEFIRSWASNPQAQTNSSKNWYEPRKQEKAVNWALIIKRRS